MSEQRSAEARVPAKVVALRGDFVEIFDYRRTQ